MGPIEFWGRKYHITITKKFEEIYLKPAIKQ